jgi:hypothetical protein
VETDKQYLEVHGNEMVRTGKKIIKKNYFHKLVVVSDNKQTAAIRKSQRLCTKKISRDRTVSRMELFNIVEVVIDRSIIEMAQHDGIYL